MTNIKGVFESIGDLDLSKIAGISLLFLPAICIYKEFIQSHLACSEKQDKEEDILEEVITSDTRIEKPFVSAPDYKIKRAERTKAAFKDAWQLVNQNLEAGNRTFSIAISETDLHIVKVVQRLLKRRLQFDGYSVKTTLPHSISEDSDTAYYLSFVIV